MDDVASGEGYPFEFRYLRLGLAHRPQPHLGRLGRQVDRNLLVRRPAGCAVEVPRLKGGVEPGRHEPLLEHPHPRVGGERSSMSISVTVLTSRPWRLVSR